MYVCLQVVAALVFVASAVAPALSIPLGIHGIGVVTRDESRLATRDPNLADRNAARWIINSDGDAVNHGQH
ncbi:hypothetical protein V8E53_005209 [Lactarius tabidus]